MFMLVFFYTKCFAAISSQNIPISAGTKSLLVTTSALGAFSSAQWRHVLRMLTADVDAQALSVASKLCQDLGLLGNTKFPVLSPWTVLYIQLDRNAGKLALGTTFTRRGQFQKR